MEQKIILFIEQQRVAKGLKKSSLCDSIISVSTYNRYLKGLDPSERVIKEMLNKLGFRLVIALK